MTDEERVVLTTEEAFERLQVHHGSIHTFITPLPGGMVIGADWSVDDIRELIDEYGAELAGPDATAFGHGVVVIRPGRNPIFLETKK